MATSVNPRVRLRPTTLTQQYPLGEPSALINHPLTQATLHILQELLVGNGLRITPRQAGETVPESELELFTLLSGTENLDLALRHLVQAYLIGSAAVEIVWGDDYLPEMLRAIPHGAAQVGLDAYGNGQSLRVRTAAGLQELPLEHVILYTYNPTLAHPLGEPRLMRYKRYLDAYDATLRAVNLYLQRHSAPTTLAQLPATYTEQEVQQVYEALVKLHDAMVAVVPAAPDTKIEYLEPRGTGMELSLQVMELIERIFVRSLLGSVLAVFESRYGTRAQAQVHWDVMRQLIASMQRPLERALDQQLWKRLAALHLGEPVGRLELNEPSGTTRSDALRALGDLVALGIVSPESDKDWLRQLIGLS